MKAIITIIPAEEKIQLRITAKSPAERMLLKKMESWAPTWNMDIDGSLECSFDLRGER